MPLSLLPDNHFACAFLPTGRFISLPNWSHQRMLLPVENATSRWQKSRMYPAFRTSAKLYRFFVRARSSLGLIQARENCSTTWLLGEFINELSLNADSAVVMIGAPGEAQKTTAQLWSKNRVVAYLKYAEKPTAKARLENEFNILLALPDGLGPKVLKYGEFLSGYALLTTPVVGRSLSPKLPPAKDLWHLLEACKGASALSVHDHPWIQSIQERGEDSILPWLDKLSAKAWPVVLHHGDFAPWNIVRVENGFQAIDWEYGDLRGFPFLDMIYYILQVSVLVKRWPPGNAKRFAITYLSQTTPQQPSVNELEALINLTAYHAYQQTLENGFTADDWVQRWRQTVWETKL